MHNDTVARHQGLWPLTEMMNYLFSWWGFGRRIMTYRPTLEAARLMLTLPLYIGARRLLHQRPPRHPELFPYRWRVLVAALAGAALVIATGALYWYVARVLKPVNVVLTFGWLLLGLLSIHQLFLMVLRDVKLPDGKKRR